MLAAFATKFDADDPLSALEVGERPEPTPPEGWTRVAVKAAALNQHDIWTLRGVGITEDRLPMTLGCDAAGIDDDGNEVIVHAVISNDDWRGDETLDPKRSLLSEIHQGTLAEYVVVPRRNVVPKPATLRSKRPRASRPRGSPRTACCSRTPARNPAARSWCKAPVAACPPRSSRSRARPATACGSPVAAKRSAPGRRDRRARRVRNRRAAP